MANLIFRKTERETLSPERIPPPLRGKVSMTARSLEEADVFVRRYDRGNERLPPILVEDERYRDEVERIGHERARTPDGKPLDGEQLVMAHKLGRKRKTYFI